MVLFKFSVFFYLLCVYPLEQVYLLLSLQGVCPYVYRPPVCWTELVPWDC